MGFIRVAWAALILIVQSSSMGCASDPSTPSGPGDCDWRVESDLPGVTVVAPDLGCSFTVQEADEGLELRFDYVVESPEDVQIETSPCLPPDGGGLRFLARLSGEDGQWCPTCDVGLCPQDDTVYTTVVGTWPQSFEIRPRAWNGPSDYGAQPGDLFEPGTYALEAVSRGTWGPVDGPLDFEISVRGPIELQ